MLRLPKQKEKEKPQENNLQRNPKKLRRKQLNIGFSYGKKTPSLAIGRGEKLSVEKGAGLTAKGRAKYNRETGSNLKAPQPQGGARKDSFCARMSGVVENAKGDAPRAKASLKRWKCSGW